MKAISLTKGQITVVDDEDYEELNQYKWCAQWSEKTKTYYAVRNLSRKLKINGKRVRLYMHRCILSTPNGYDTDHKNGDTLDNRRSNLRVSTRSQNTSNSKKYKGTSQYRGVSWSKKSNTWKVGIKKDNKSIHVGYFKSEKDAADAYNNIATILFGEFARLNEI